MYMTGHGSGSPTIVLVSRLGERAGNWAMTSDPETLGCAVFQKAGGISRVGAYDRLVLPAAVNVAMGEIAGAVREGLLALAELIVSGPR